MNAKNNYKKDIISLIDRLYDLSIKEFNDISNSNSSLSLNTRIASNTISNFIVRLKVGIKNM